MGTFEGKLGDYDSFLEYYKLQKKLGVLLLKVYQYAALTSDLNKKDTTNAARVQKMAFLMSKLNQTTAYEAPELLSIGKEKIDSLLLSNFKRNEISKNASLRVANFTFKRKAKMMLKKNMDTQTIAEITGLTIEEIEALKP